MSVSFTSRGASLLLLSRISESAKFDGFPRETLIERKQTAELKAGEDVRYGGQH